jgi:YhcH/YjgK/YiaL family protein
MPFRPDTTFPGMALTGTLDQLAQALAADPRFAAAFPYLKRCVTPASAEAARIGNIAPGAVEEIRLDGGTLAFEQVYHTRGREACFFESHRKYIDVQLILEGEEVMDAIPIGELKLDKPYAAEKDLVTYHDPGARSAGAERYVVKAGQAAVFFPEDGHMPGQFDKASGLVRKTVAKIPVAPA